MTQHTFSDLGVIGPVHFQGGMIFLRGHGCRNCGHGFWTEGDPARILPPGEHPCPHCGQLSEVPSGD